MLTVREIWRFPVKSMGGERVEQVTVSDTGIIGDRAWGVRDEATGMVLTARREPRLLMATATLHDGMPVVHLPDGRALASSAELSQWLDRPVTLVAANSTPGTFENPRDVENEDDWHSWQGPVGSFHDRPRVSMVSLASLGDFEPKRFRINLVLDHGDESGASDDDAKSATSETSLVDRDVTVGSVGLHVRSRISRCIMVTRAQPGIEADPGVFTRLVREHDNRMGVGADVYREGRLAVGDVVHPLPE